MRPIRLSPTSVATIKELGYNVEPFVVARHANGDVSVQLPRPAWELWQRNRRKAPLLTDDEFFLEWVQQAMPKDGTTRRPLQ